jgi:predicted DCC family thiol-disulfide oxidoreductase YuxK
MQTVNGHPETHALPLILFDGTCHYCHWMVQLAIRYDPKKKLRFAPLQGATAQDMKRQFHLDEHTDSVVLIEQGQVFYYSTAALRSCAYLQAPLSWLRVGLIVPTKLRDKIYQWVAANRYRWFGRYETCRIPQGVDLDRFLP